MLTILTIGDFNSFLGFLGHPVYYKESNLSTLYTSLIMHCITQYTYCQLILCNENTSLASVIMNREQIELSQTSLVRGRFNHYILKNHGISL